MKFDCFYTISDMPVKDQITWRIVDVCIKDASNKIIFEQKNVEVPSWWSDQAAMILASKYFRKAGVPNLTILSNSEDFHTSMPTWLLPSMPDTANLDFYFDGETSAHQVFHRMAGAWTYWGWKEGLFNYETAPKGNVGQSEDYARIFYDEIYMMLAKQIAAPNSPQWFSTGLHWAYGIEGDANGQWAIDKDGMTFLTPNAYERPQPHACFLSSVTDDLVNPGGIMDLWVREARIFKHGSGSGTNISNIRAKGEPLSGGGIASGVMSWLRIGDSAAGAIQSGGTTRRAAVMRCLDIDHPEIEEFITWKQREEAKAAAMYVGSNVAHDLRHMIKEGNQSGDVLPQAVIDRIRADIIPEIFGINYEGEAIKSVDGQNSNNSIWITDNFLSHINGGPNTKDWPLTARTTGKPTKIVCAHDLWQKICLAAWACADPGVLFSDTGNSWNTCAADGRIRTVNPCAEYWFLDNTACNLASLRLTAFLNGDGTLDIPAYEHACRLWAIILDISISMASFPAREFAIGTYNYRTLGLGYADLGGLLMRLALPYDSDEGRALAAQLTALMTGIAYRTSAELANELGAFPRWEANAQDMRRVLRNHARAAGLSSREITEVVDPNDDYEDLNIRPQELSRDNVEGSNLYQRIMSVWKDVCHAKSFRNTQVTLIAPTGTISLIMDCDTSGIEPDFALIKHKQLAGGGSMHMVNTAVKEALRRLNYTKSEISAIEECIQTTGTPVNCPHIRPEHWKVFDCAVGVKGHPYRCLSPEAHVRMVAAVQPFLSGGVSKTVNLPASSTINDVDRIYRMAHKLGLKSIAIYRDGSKLTQPLTTTEHKKVEYGTNEQWREAMDYAENMIYKDNKVSDPYNTTTTRSDTLAIYTSADYNKPQIQTTMVPYSDGISNKTLPLPPPLSRGERERLSWSRRGQTQKMRVGGQSLYLHTGEYSDGRLGEFFLTMSKEGSTARALVEGFAKCASIALQHGVPLTTLCDAFTSVRFEPSGIVEGHDEIKMCSSILDLVFRDLAGRYLSKKPDEALREFTKDIATRQQPLGEDFEKVLNENRYELHAKSSVGAARITPDYDLCPQCGHHSLFRAGTCFTCSECAYNTGCG